jgi:hypothetical protein
MNPRLRVTVGVQGVQAPGRRVSRFNAPRTTVRHTTHSTGRRPTGCSVPDIRDHRRSTTMNALIYEQIARERHREAHTEARSLDQGHP